jgi:ssDNA-binding replication factor A large subunit
MGLVRLSLHDQTKRRVGRSANQDGLGSVIELERIDGKIFKNYSTASEYTPSQKRRHDPKMTAQPASHSTGGSGFSISLSPSIVTSVLWVSEGAYTNGEIHACKSESKSRTIALRIVKLAKNRRFSEKAGDLPKRWTTAADDL